jgi:hypothetical protein
MPFILAILAALTGVLTWMFASAGLRRYRTVPGADWTELVPGIVVGLLTVLLAVMAVFAAKVNRRRADVAARIAQSPDRLWLHVAEWNRGRIQDAPAKQGAVAIGAFAVMWNAVVAGVALLARGRDDLRSDATVVDDSAVFEVPVFPTEASDKTFVTGSVAGAVSDPERT